MKAAVISTFGQIPQFIEFPEPASASEGTPVTVLASVLENFDKLVASGNHYSSQQVFPAFPAIVGTDGVGKTYDGKLVSFGQIKHPFGAFAEKAVAGYTIPVPEGIEPAKAAAIPSSVLTSLLPLKYTASIQKGDTVFINGGTGVSGRIAIQVAKMLGAGNVIATGRSAQSLQLIKSLGADEVINLQQSDEELANAFSHATHQYGCDIVLDFLWGHPASLLINSLIPGEVGFPQKTIRYIQCGEKAGTHINLPASALRTSGLQLMGVGPLTMQTVFEELNNIWAWIKEDRFYMEIECMPLSRISEAWQQDIPSGTRLVIVP